MKVTMGLVLLHVIWSVELKLDCHKICFCIVWKKLAVCSKQNLSKLPDGVPKHYTHLNMSYNIISSLLPGDFEKAALLHLESLDLSFCNIRTIESGTFSGMSNLTELKLNNNYIETLQSDMFCNATSLVKLSLASNLIHAVELNAFCGIRALIMLNLKNNSINKMENHMFKGLTNLTGISLRSNKILEVPTGIFEDQKKLMFLDLGYNNIATMTTASLLSLHSLIVLYLPNNSLHCDSELKNAFVWLTEHSVSVVASCVTPEEVSGQPWQAMLHVVSNGTAFQVVNDGGSLPFSSLIYVLTVFTTLTAVVAVSISIYKYFIRHQHRKQQFLSSNMLALSQDHTASAQTIESES